MDKIITKILPMLISVLSPSLKDMLCKFVDEFEIKAKATANDWDDVAAYLLKSLFCPKV